VSVNGRRGNTLTPAQMRRPVRITGLPGGHFVVSVTAITTDGRRVSARRTYQACETRRPAAERLIVTLAGGGSGRVTGGGISCPGTCSRSYAAGTKVTLSPAASGGSTFSGWSRGGCAGAGKCTLILSANRSVTATFTAAKPVIRSLKVSLAGSGSGNVTGGGISCPGTCAQNYPAGTRVSLNASPASGSSFTGWSGAGCSGTAQCAVTLSSDQAVTATFSANPVTPPAPGSYSGATSQSIAMSFTVSSGSTALQNLTVPTSMGCVPSKTVNDQLQFGSIPIAADGSFSGTATQTGVIDSATAQFSYTFSGHFHGTNTSGAERVAGQLREDVTFNDGTAFSCTTNVQTWSATH
jgi:Divergent InlB B-repeat domain